MAGKTVPSTTCLRCLLYQLGNWMAGKTWRHRQPPPRRLYQLGNWMAGKTSPWPARWIASIVPTGELDGRQDLRPLLLCVSMIVPTGELDGRQDL